MSRACCRTAEVEVYYKISTELQYAIISDYDRPPHGRNLIHHRRETEPLSVGAPSSAITQNKIETSNNYSNLVQIYISKNGQRMGPYTYEEVQSLLARGSLLPTDLAWHAGLENWTQLSTIPPQKANKSNLALFGYIPAIGILLGGGWLGLQEGVKVRNS